MILDKTHLDQYKNYLEMGRYSDNTKQNYLYFFNKLIGKNITQDLIDQHCYKGHAVYRSFLKTMLECLKLNKELTIPKIRGRRQQRDIVYYTPAEIEKILQHTRLTYYNIMIRLMYENGLRISEVINLKKTDFDLINNTAKGIGKGNKEFTIQLFPETAEKVSKYLAQLKPGEEPFIYPGIKHQRQKALYDIKKIIKEALPYKTDKEAFCHAFRHSTGTNLRDIGFDLRQIQEYLRHAQLNTVAMYTAIDKKKLQQQVTEQFHKKKEEKEGV